MTRGPDREYTRQDVLRALQRRARDSYEPWTTSEIADEIGCSTDIAYNRLHELVELDRVGTKKTGSRSRVWWLAKPPVT